ncbi:beta-sarcoglycan isoform X2 [Parasteatoda tepidariorum]|uniref:beta-sarcoglycan isoform X2 n=1 Tax=Parasteatoda tepidariorum TaxID=114398 RepID=UPI00077FD9E2|nr:beta-sarcoglycan isoform X2 [Parasteatoda tepidariorum]
MAAGEGTNTLSMREKALLKQHINNHHVSAHPGYVPVSELYLHKTGLRGKKGIMFYALVVLLFTIALINLAVIVVLLSVLRIGYGMESMEFIRYGKLLRFLNHADMGTITPDTGVIGGFSDSDLPIIGDNKPIIFRTGPRMNTGKSGPSLEIHHDHTIISGVEEFLIQSPTSGKKIFSTDYNDFKLPTGVSHLSVKEAHVSRIVSKKNESLEISSPYQVILKGNEGLTMAGKEIVWVTGVDLYLKSVNQSIILDGADGVMVSAGKLPFAAETQDSAPRWYKLCVCMPSGRVFRIPVREQGYGCNDVRFPESINPCS